MWLLAAAVVAVMCVDPVRSLEYSITTTWNGGALEHVPVNLSLASSSDQKHLILSISAPFFNDPPSPPGPPGQPFYGLWDYEVVEAFFLNDANQYLEVELCPWGQHIVLLLSGQRITVRHSLPLEVSTQRGDGVWSGTAAIPVSYLPEKVTKFNAYAIHGSGEERVYEALYPAPSTALNPDFHALEYFQPIDLSGILPNQATDPKSQLWVDALQGLFRYDIATTWNDEPLTAPLVQITLQGFEAGVEMNVTAPFYNDPAPSGPPGEPFYSLWDYEVVEMFFLNKNDEYLEVELGPWGQHLLLLLKGERNAIKHSLPLDFIIMEKTDPVGDAPGQWRGSAMIPPGYFPPNVTLMNAYAIHGEGEARQYQALYPAPNNDPNYPNADFHRLDLFRPIDFEFQVRDNKVYSQVWLDAINSGATTTNELTTQEAVEMTTLGQLRTVHFFNSETADTFAEESDNIDSETTVTPTPDDVPETTTYLELRDNTLAVASSSGSKEGIPMIPLPPKPVEQDVTTTLDPDETFPETTLPSELEDRTLEPTTYPEPVQGESAPEVLPPQNPQESDNEITTNLPETLFREDVQETTLPSQPESTNPEITTVPPKTTDSSPEPTTLAPVPFTIISRFDNVPVETFPLKSTDITADNDNEAAPQEQTTLPPTTPAPTTLPEPPEASTPTQSPGNINTAGRRRPRPQRVNYNSNRRIGLAPQNLPVRTRGRPVPHPQRVRPNRRVAGHGVRQQGLPIQGGLHPEDFLVHLGQHLLSQHQGLEFPPSRDQAFMSQPNQPPQFFSQDHQFQPPRSQGFQPPRNQGFQPPVDHQFPPPSFHQFQPPVSQPDQPLEDQAFQIPSDQAFQPPVSQPDEPPKDQKFQIPKEQAFQPPVDQPDQPPKDQAFQPPSNQAFPPSVSPIPSDQAFQHPVSQPDQPPKDQEFQIPSDQAFQHPVSQPDQPPKDQEFQVSEDRESQPRDQPLSAPQQEKQDQVHRRPPSGEQQHQHHQQHQFPPSRGEGVSLGEAGEEEVGLQEVEEVIASLAEGSPALPPPHPLCFTPGLIPDEHRCWVFHECELVNGQWQVYSWKCIRGHVFDPFNVACVPGRCRRRRRG